MNAEVSIVVAFYNNTRALKLVIASLEAQVFGDFEVLIADDGSASESVKEVQQIMSRSNLRIRHVWHEDKGWRKNTILNRCIVASRSDYLVFIDGDCVLHPYFVREHLTLRKKKTLLAGRRVDLSKFMSEKLSTEKIKTGYLSNRIFWSCLLNYFFGSTRRLHQGIYVSWPVFSDFLNRKEKGVLGSNFSVHKNDLEEINGFDERFGEPGAGEDTDVEMRLRRNGVEVRPIRNRAVQFHLYHEKLPRKPGRLACLEENNRNQVTYTPYGIRREGHHSQST